jgi:hypothetical protein
MKKNGIEKQEVHHSKKDHSRKEGKMINELHCIGLINKIDDVAKNEGMEYYHRIVVIKQLIEDYRKKE